MDLLLSALRAAAEPSRLRLLALCAEGELTVSELVRITGQSQPRISRHLKVLTDAGVLERFTEGNWVFHRLARTGPGGALGRDLVGLLSAGGPVLAADRARLAEVQSDRAAAAERYFRANAEDWNRLRSLYVDEAEVESALASFWPADPVERYLDVGTGTGRMLELFGRRARSAIGIDRSTDMLALARAALERAGLDACTVRQADLYHLPFADGGTGVVTVHQVLHFLDDPARAVAEAARVLAPGGRLLIADFAPHGLEALRTEHAHRRLGFADGEVAGWMAQAGLSVAPVRHLAGTPLTVVIWMGEKPCAQVPAAAANLLSPFTAGTGPTP